MSVRDFLHRIACILWLVLAASAAHGQTQAPSWTLMKGSAVDLAVDAGGDAFAVTPDGTIWRWRHESADWGSMSGTLTRVAAGSGGKPWGLGADGTVLRYNGLWWEALEKRGQDIALDLANNAYVVLRDGTLARYNSLRGDWESLPGSGRRRIAATPEGVPWTVGEDGSIARYDGRQWQAQPGSARDIGIGTDGAVFIIDQEGRLARWDEGRRGWNSVEAPPDLAVVAVAPGGIPWVATGRGAIYAGALPAAPTKEKAPSAYIAPPSVVSQRAARRNDRQAAAAAVLAASPARRTDPSPFEFIDTRATAAAVAIGLDGSVFALGGDGQLYRWNNGERRLLPFPGQLLKIAVDPAGNPWGINIFGRIFRHDGADWRQVRGTASDISIAANGTVLVADANGVLGRYDAASNGFVRIEGSAVFVAAAPDGTPWGLLADGTVVRCSAVPCDRFGRQGRSLAIGPDGSVFLVGNDNRLQRYNAASGEWELVPVPNHTPKAVAVGPRGRPWVLTTQQKLLASAFFERDESLDRQVAAGTQGSTTGSGDAATVVSSPTASGGFVFTKNLRLTTYHYSGNLDTFTVGSDGSVLAKETTFLSKLNLKTRSFNAVVEVPESVWTAVTGPDGLIWAISISNNGRIFKQRSANVMAFDTIQIPVAAGCFPCNRDLAVASDGSVYAIDTAGTVWRKPANSNVFSKFVQGSYRHVAAGRAGDVWLIDDNDYVRQVVNGKAELRPASRPAKAGAIATGPDGSVWGAVAKDPMFSVYTLARWNATNQTFDFTNHDLGIPVVAVGVDGRPWFSDLSLGTDINNGR